MKRRVFDRHGQAGNGWDKMFKSFREVERRELESIPIEAFTMEEKCWGCERRRRSVDSEGLCRSCRRELRD